jgi:hypothetical protein
MRSTAARALLCADAGGAMALGATVMNAGAARALSAAAARSAPVAATRQADGMQRAEAQPAGPSGELPQESMDSAWSACRAACARSDSAYTRPARMWPPAGVAAPLQWVFLGPPGVGKGTYASRAARHFGAAHISTGDLVREEMKGGTVLGKQVRPVAFRPLYVPAEKLRVRLCVAFLS